MTATALAPPSRNESLRYGIRLSLGIHLLILIVILIKGLAFPGKPLRHIPALKVDLVALPDVLKKDLVRPSDSKMSRDIEKILKQATPTQSDVKQNQSEKRKVETNEDTGLKPSSRPRNVEQRNKQALDRIKSLAKIQDFAKEPQNQKNTLIRGNQISNGTSLSAEARENAEANYLDLLKDRLQDNWVLPPWIARMDLSAQVRLFMDSRGKVRTFRFVKTSGNEQFDDAIKKALQESQPFPFPPHELEATLLTDGILIGFPL